MFVGRLRLFIIFWVFFCSSVFSFVLVLVWVVRIRFFRILFLFFFKRDGLIVRFFMLFLLFRCIVIRLVLVEFLVFSFMICFCREFICFCICLVCFIILRKFIGLFFCLFYWDCGLKFCWLILNWLSIWFVFV